MYFVDGSKELFFTSFGLALAEAWAVSIRQGGAAVPVYEAHGLPNGDNVESIVATVRHPTCA